MKKLLLCLMTIAIGISLSATEQRPLTVEDMWAMGRVSEATISPDNMWAAYTITRYSMKTNKGNSNIWLIALKSDDQTPRQLTASQKNEYNPSWSPDSSKLAFISTRNGAPQIFIININSGETTQLSHISTGAGNPVWSPDGRYIAFSSKVYPDLKTDAENKSRDNAKEKSPIKAQVIDNLLFRHWNSWREGKRSHVFLIKSSGGEAWDVTPGDYDTPPISLGGNQDYTFSPDSKKIAFVRNTDDKVAISTNNDIFTSPIKSGRPTRLTTNKGNDNNPIYSPDGKYLGFLSMEREGFEADQTNIILHERATGKLLNLTENFDRSISEFIFSPAGKKVFFIAKDQGRNRIFSVQIKNGKCETIVKEHCSKNLNITKDGNTLIFTQQATNLPYELFKVPSNGKKDPVQLTFTNLERLNQLIMHPLEDFWFESFDGKKVHGLLVKPPRFNPDKKYPLIYLIHGGPQGGWTDDFHYRWNAQMFAAPGYVVAMVNFRGSKGYGQEFCDAVSKDWGGGPYKDLMLGLDYILSKYDFIDKNKLAAAGASYGGFMVDWIAGHTDRFKALVSHDGVFDQRSMYGATEELWFPEWEFNGTPYHNPELYKKFSPSYYVKNFKTPTLVIHGQKDFRVPVTQGFQMFTALQRMGVPSRLLYFPDEDHFVQKPQNARLWWKTVHEWIAEWINRETSTRE